MDTILITGANRGIGLEFTRQYLEQGDQVIGTVRNPGEADQLQELGQTHDDRLQVVSLDVTDQESIEQAHGQVRDQIDGLDLLINNAGIMGSKEDFDAITDLDLLTVFDTNALGPFRVTQKLLPLVRKQGGTVAFITSLMGSIEDNGIGGSYPYRMSKAALNMLGKTLSRDYSVEEARFILLHPGWVKTRMGGENAKITRETSVEGLRSVIREMDESMNGGFYNYAGEELPW